MNRRQLLQAFAGVAIGASPLGAAASIPAGRDGKSVAIIAIGKAGTHTAYVLLEELAVRIPVLAIGACALYSGIFRRAFDRVYCVDERCLPDRDGHVSYPAMYERLGKELRTQLPKEERWLIVGSQSGSSGSVLIPLAARAARASGRQAHVFALGPECLEGETAIRLAARARLEVERWASDCVTMPNGSWAGHAAEDAVWDYLDALDRACLAWAKSLLA